MDPTRTPMTDAALVPPCRKDRGITVLGMALLAFCVGGAINVSLGDYSRGAIIWLSIAALICLLAVALPAIARLQSLAARSLTAVLVIGIAFQCGMLLRGGVGGAQGSPLVHDAYADATVLTGLIFVGALGCVQAFIQRRLRWPLILIMLVAFCLVGTTQFRRYLNGVPGVDVFFFQQQACDALVHDRNLHEPPAILHGRNPYAMRYHNIYEPDTPFYGPGVVDQDNFLTYGYPYPPLSLLMVLPGYLLGGDCRYAHVLAMALSAGLMAAARPGRWGALAATLFLLTPRAFWVLDLAWTEPLLTLNFSLVMFCACRCRRLLPYALGLYFATKQYTVLTLPALWLLVDEPDRCKALGKLILKAAIVAAVITFPFFLWNPYDFIRDVVLWQFFQPFRPDALSYLVAIYRYTRGYHPPIWTPLAAVVPAAALAMWRCARSPSGFAAAVTCIHLAFFAFNKQAFCNYYYFVMATACWAVAAAKAADFAPRARAVQV